MRLLLSYKMRASKPSGPSESPGKGPTILEIAKEVKTSLTRSKVNLTLPLTMTPNWPGIIPTKAAKDSPALLLLVNEPSRCAFTSDIRSASELRQMKESLSWRLSGCVELYVSGLCTRQIRVKESSNCQKDKRLYSAECNVKELLTNAPLADLMASMAPGSSTFRMSHIEMASSAALSLMHIKPECLSISATFTNLSGFLSSSGNMKGFLAEKEVAWS